MQAVLIEPQYFPPVQYFPLFSSRDEVIIDDRGRFEKQTYRNRAMISSANKILPLIVPLQQGKTSLPINEVKIDYSQNWQKHHLASIRSAYNKSPFFMYYEDALLPFFNKKTRFLLDLDIEIMMVLLKQLKLPANLRLASSLTGTGKANIIDARSLIHPGKEITAPFLQYRDIPYMQVFHEKTGFLPGLSVMDLLFNEGPNSAEVIRQMMS